MSELEEALNRVQSCLAFGSSGGWHNHNIPKPDDVLALWDEYERLKSEAVALRETLSECVSALEEQIRDYRQPGHEHAEILERRYEVDMAPVLKGRALLSQPQNEAGE